MANAIVVKISLGAVLVLFGILMLHKGVTIMDLDFEFIGESLSEWTEFTPYLLLGFASGFCGFLLFFTSLAKLNNSDL